MRHLTRRRLVGAARRVLGVSSVHKQFVVATSIRTGLLIALATHALASDPSPVPTPHEGRGFVFGIGLGPSQMRFGGADGLALVIGGPTGTIPLLGGESLVARSGEIVPLALVLPGADGVVPIPKSQGGAAVSLQFGWSFSRRLALLADVEANGGWDNSFNHVVGGLPVRYSPVWRLWVQAGPAAGAVKYGFSNSVVDFSGTGKGFLVAAGVILVRRPMWLLDLQARSLPLWYERCSAPSLSVQLGIIRRRS